MSSITYTINLGSKSQNQMNDWRVSPSISQNSGSYSVFDTIVDFEPFSVVEIPVLKENDLRKETDVESKISESYPERIVLPTAEGIHLIEVSKIIRLEADKNYTMVHIEGQSPILISKTLKDVEKQLDPEIFFRIHQSHTVDIKKIDIYHRGRGGSVTLRNGDLLPVSKNKKEALLEVLL